MRASVYLAAVAALAALSSCSGLYFQINENEVRVSVRCCCPPMPPRLPLRSLRFASTMPSL